MRSKRHSKSTEWTKNFFLILLAGVVIWVFFSLDIIKKGESMFSNTASKKLKFSGNFTRKEYTDREVDRLLSYIKTRNKLLEEVKIQATTQDSYRKITPDTEILFEVHVTMDDGFTFTTPLRRSKRKRLVSGILTKLDKDVRAYLEMRKQGKKMKGLVNTM
ncbi:hypothetical protein [Pseudodesulfovibrio sediminis]|uniref:Uncharacterized protein n=1 Tax=Pseudodesulfovibrio sediminis TaxID=2810563 RepID=A0ABN6EVD7_9BACT|nr:hypothetical protein [Pseudodesulfovibrio sediminis]BCS89170.1 hypothetical protein PSDVSF_24120 [Pseudodesulfovibrio sediminis]